jgi:large subunit ribosomal protein L13
MDMNRAFLVKEGNHATRWQLIDAQGQVVGRLATKIAIMLRGKDTAAYTPHCAQDTHLVVINAEKIVFTGDKMANKEYQSYSGWIGGLKTLTARELMAKDPTLILELAVKGMLPKTKQSRELMRRLKIYVGDKHPHTAQIENA